MKTTLSAAALAVVVSVSSASAATLDGDVIQVSYASSTITSVLASDRLTAGAGVEDSCLANTGSAFVPCLQAIPHWILTATRSASRKILAQGAVLTAPPRLMDGFSRGSIGTGLTGITVTATGFENPLQSLLSFTADSITFNLQGQNVFATNSWTMVLETAPSAVPLPASGLALALGLGGFVAVRCRQRA